VHEPEPEPEPEPEAVKKEPNQYEEHPFIDANNTTNDEENPINNQAIKFKGVTFVDPVVESEDESGTKFVSTEREISDKDIDELLRLFSENETTGIEGYADDFSEPLPKEDE
jgi:hypothetical protein